jgi:HEAT repeat protein
MKDADVDIRKEIALTLGKIGGEEVVSGLFRLLNDESSEVRWRSAMALWLRQGMKVSFLS